MDEKQRRRAARDSGFGNGEVGGGSTSSHPVHGTNAQGEPVTASFGDRDNTYLRDGHAESSADFWGPNDDKEHDDYGPGDGPNDNGTQRGKYTGYGS